ncbi:hypothetical protein C8D88_116124 [Lentzea atacamensis]|uniref:Uncharacterized protein n=1 Tax=Lentzea atacamensis TaxID=531938 RepID=A0A316HTV5_9PSEU|nr:hypothetical protein [Lentzea atacamensis]PWK81712.1 hypothetical protein C8D88_116124 [Lentzea atacamensis]
MSVEIDLEHARVVRVQPGDVVVLRTDWPCSMQEVHAITQRVKRFFPDNECVVLSGAELEVFRSEEQPPR